MQPRLRQVPPDLALLDDGHVQARRRGVQGCAVATRPTADDHEVERVLVLGAVLKQLQP
jgi:hypothetical protein